MLQENVTPRLKFLTLLNFIVKSITLSTFFILVCSNKIEQVQTDAGTIIKWCLHIAITCNISNIKPNTYIHTRGRTGYWILYDLFQNISKTMSNNISHDIQCTNCVSYTYSYIFQSYLEININYVVSAFQRSVNSYRYDTMSTYMDAAVWIQGYIRGVLPVQS